MSATALARLVDDAVARGAFVTEGPDVVVTSNLGAAEVASLSRGVDEVGWTMRIRDAAGGEWTPADLDEAFAPFVMTITKPAQPDGTLAVLTAAGLRQQLRADAPQRRWRVGVLEAPIRTWDLLLMPWDSDEQVEAELPTVNPRRLVREVGAERIVPTSLARWLLRRDQPLDLQATAQRIWANEADWRIAASLANEIDPDTRELMFRGPPRLTLKLSGDEGERFLADLFPRLQEAGSWVYENERETELRHTLLATEIARSGGGGDAFAQLVTSLRPSLDGARIAYEMSVSAMSADTLKALADLRKAITDETAKVTEATRQTIAALTGALAIGVGLVAAKLTTATDPLVLAAVMAVAALYVILVTASGAQFVLLQRKVRSDWQATLYRFLPAADYRRLVTKPAGRAEFAFWTAAVIGILATALLAVAVAKAEPKPPAPVRDRPRSKPSAPVGPAAGAHARSDRAAQANRPQGLGGGSDHVRSRGGSAGDRRQ